MITSRFTAPAALAHRFQDLRAPRYPDGSWLAAVAEAIEAGLDEGEPFPWPPQEGGQPLLPPPAAQQQAEDGVEPQSQAQPQQQVQQWQVEQQSAAQQLQPQGEQQEAVAEVPGAEATAATAVPAPADVAAAGAEEPALQARRLLAAVPVGGGAPVVVMHPEGSTDGHTLPDRPSVLLKQSTFTEMSERRLRWLIARIGRTGFLLAAELPRFLQVAAQGGSCSEARGCYRVLKHWRAATPARCTAQPCLRSAAGPLRHRPLSATVSCGP